MTGEPHLHTLYPFSNTLQETALPRTYGSLASVLYTSSLRRVIGASRHDMMRLRAAWIIFTEVSGSLLQVSVMLWPSVC